MDFVDDQLFPRRSFVSYSWRLRHKMRKVDDTILLATMYLTRIWIGPQEGILPMVDEIFVGIAGRGLGNPSRPVAVAFLS
jgi:hypothetical protein